MNRNVIEQVSGFLKMKESAYCQLSKRDKPENGSLTDCR